jgi:hypothetical protein
MNKVLQILATFCENYFGKKNITVEISFVLQICQILILKITKIAYNMKECLRFTTIKILNIIKFG